MTALLLSGARVIDPSTGTMYCVAKTKEGGRYPQRLHALDIVTGKEKLGGPVLIDGNVSGTGDGSKRGTIAFDSLRHLNRPSLLLQDGYVYLAADSAERTARRL